MVALLMAEANDGVGEGGMNGFEKDVEVVEAIAWEVNFDELRGK